MVKLFSKPENMDITHFKVGWFWLAVCYGCLVHGYFQAEKGKQKYATKNVETLLCVQLSGFDKLYEVAEKFKEKVRLRDRQTNSRE